MNIKHAILPLVATGGIAAALFGGTAVSTAFTSNTQGTMGAGAAKVAASEPVALGLLREWSDARWSRCARFDDVHELQQHAG